jgi:very-short-patch-repair endonuclease
MMSQCDSDLERDWLRLVHRTNRAIPTHAQYLIESCRTRPDFFYHDKRTAIYIDGPVHDHEGTEEKDTVIEARLMAAGIMSIRFHHAEDWEAKLKDFPDIFGSSSGVRT